MEPSSPKADEEPAIPSSRSQRSIISGMSERSDRKDAHGNAIEKGSKGHKASFRDEVAAAPISEVKEVVAYKSNYINSNFDDGEKQTCGCSLM